MTFPRGLLREQCDLITKGTTPSSVGLEFSAAGIGFLRAQDVGNGKVAPFGPELYISSETHRLLQRSTVFSGDVLVTIAGTIGRVGVVGPGSYEFNCNQAVAIVRANEMLYPSFLRYWLESKEAQRQMKGSTVTATVANLSLSQLGSLSIPVPPLEEQRRIAAILDAADALREKRRQALALVEQLTQSVFLEMFGEQYPVIRISDVCVVKGGKRLPKGADYSDEETPFRYIRVSDMSEGKVDVLALRYLLPEIQAKIAKYTVADGDVVISIAGTIGVIAVIDSELNGANLTENAAKISPRSKGVYDPIYLAWALKSHDVQNQIAQRTGQVTIGKLALFRIEGIEFPLPPLELQQEFARRVEAIEKLKVAHQQSLQEMDALFASLQHRAFRGEL